MSDVKSAVDWFPIALDQVKLFRALYVGTSGDISITSANGSTQVFKNVPIGTFPVSGTKVNTTGTGASNLVGLL